METGYDLLTEPWITALGCDGGTVEYGLRDIILNAHELQEIRDPLPTAEFGIHRLIVAVVMDAFELKSVDDLADLLEEGKFDPAVVDGYFEQWGDRFDLFHSKYPFLQCADMDKEKDKPLAGLVHAIPSGTNVNLFLHMDEDNFRVSAKSAARLLTTIAPFMTAGGAGLAPSINGAPPWYVLVQGKSLFDTICLNCCVWYTGSECKNPPAWRDPRQLECKRYSEVGLLESLTWRPRKIKLVPEGEGTCCIDGCESDVTVSRMKFTAGAACALDNWCDPNVPYKITKDGRLVLRPQPGREIWRDIGPLALLQDGDYESEQGKVSFSRPLIVHQLYELHKRRYIREDYPLNFIAYGLRTDMKMKIFEWQRERLSFPVPLIYRDWTHEHAQKAIDQAERVDYLIGKAIKSAYPRNGSGNKKAFDALADDATKAFWRTMHGHYDTLLHALSATEYDEAAIVAALSEWERALEIIAWKTLDDALNSMDSNNKSIKRQQVDARKILARGIYSIFKYQKNSSDEGEEQ